MVRSKKSSRPQVRSEKETRTAERAAAQRVVHDVEPVPMIPDLDSNVTQQAENLYENLIDEEGFSEEQAFQIALTRTGKEGGLLDEGLERGENEDELIIHEEESPLRDQS